MSERTYNTITHACFTVAVLSAILFDNGTTWRWAATIFAACAAAFAVALHFYRTWDLPDES